MKYDVTIRMQIDGVGIQHVLDTLKEMPVIDVMAVNSTMTIAVMDDNADAMAVFPVAANSVC